MDDVSRQIRGLMCLVAVGTVAGWASAGPIREGFDAAALPAAAPNESVRFFGHTFDALRVDARGNVSFAAPLPEFAPVPLGNLRDANISPFFAGPDAAETPTGGGGLASAGTGTHASPAAGPGAVPDRLQPSAAGGAAGGGGTGGGGGGAAGSGGASPSGGRAATAGNGWAAIRSMFPTVGGPDDEIDTSTLASELLRPEEVGLESTNGTSGDPSGPDELKPTASSGAPLGVVGTPEPGTLLLGLIGAAGLFAARRRKATP